jgi:raffinose/stachyose/melibiose transport system permease protein
MIAEKNPLKRLGNQLFFTLPNIVFFMMALVIPFAYGLYLTFMKQNYITDPLTYAGWSNYSDAITDVDFWISIKKTLKFVGWTVVSVNVIAFGLAYLVSSGIKGQNFFRTALFTPNLIGGLVLGYIWQFIFAQSLPLLGSKLGWGLFEYNWLGDEVTAFWAMIVVSVWQSAGYMMIIFIAGLMSIPKDIIEASTIDGASGFRRLTHMVLPLMVPSFVVTIFLTLKGAFMVYDINYSLTAGGPYNSTKLVSMHIVSKAFDQFNYGLGQAEAIVLFLMVATITTLQVYFSKKLEVEA